ncbi:AzlD domain-containing protein [Pelagibius sp.]|uniref:AzlD domain-containing protein n=1 Tax=Pelagibius sp. TaxID=1931238 RepID=UPI003B508F3D
MADSLSIFLAIAVMALTTLATRLLGPVVVSRFKMTRALEHFLTALCSSVIVAIVATVVAQGGWREAAAVAVAAGVMVITRSAVWAMLAGAGCAALWRAALG